MHVMPAAASTAIRRLALRRYLLRLRKCQPLLLLLLLLVRLVVAGSAHVLRAEPAVPVRVPWLEAIAPHVRDHHAAVARIGGLQPQPP